jgi:small-conductance mechanosensitive channel
MSATQTSELKGLLSHQLEFLQRIDLLFGQQMAAIQAKSNLVAKRSKTEMEATQKAFAGKGEASKPSFLDLDKLKDDLDALRSRGKSVDSRVEARKSALDDAAKGFDEAENARLRAKEEAESNKDQTAALLLNEKLKAAEADSRAATETVRLRALELDNENLDQEIFRLEVAGLEGRVKWLEEQALFTKQDLDGQREAIHKKTLELKGEKTAAESEQRSSEDRLAKSIERLNRSAAKDQALEEEVAARKREADYRRRQVELLASQLVRLDDQDTTWERRYATVTRDSEPEDLSKWSDEAGARRAQYGSEYGLATTTLADLRRELQALEEKIQGSKETNSSTAKSLAEQRTYLENLIRVEDENLQSLEEARRLEDHLVREINAVKSTWHASEWFALFGAALMNTWHYSLSGALTVQKIVTALVLFTFGFTVSRYLSRVLERRILNRMRLPKGAAAALRVLSYYLLVALSTMLALHVAQVPLTPFAFMGGALAIGLGFGSQHILNNFISGLILLIERPIQVGDQIEHQAGSVGTVIRIGARCTHIRTGSNVDVFIPNSSLLQNNIINWTRTDDKVRVQINVPVQYGAPTREVARLLRKAADEHGKILKKPEPMVLLKDFGPNGFEFQVSFWLLMTQGTDRAVVESDVRFIIEHYFSEVGIVMAYAQRDVHIDSKSPIEVRMAKEEVPKEA